MPLPLINLGVLTSIVQYGSVGFGITLLRLAICFRCHSGKDPEAYRRITGRQHEAFAYDMGPILIPYVIYFELFPAKYNIYHVQDIFLDSRQTQCYFLPYDIIIGLQR